MKSKILILLLFCSFLSFGQSVPNTNTFSLQDVVNVVGGTSLTQAFSNSVDAYFDPAYKGSKDRLSNFRNYTIQSYSLPTVTTASITAITATTATGGGTVSSDGGATVTDRGIQWSLYSDFSVIAGSASSGSGTGSFTSNMTGLTANTTYYVRAYATNSIGTATGSSMSFTTATISFISYTSYQTTASANFSFTLPTCKLFVLTIHTTNNTSRSGSAPTINGVAMTQVGSYAGSYATEIWYKINPSSGSNTVIVPQSGSNNMVMTGSWYSCAGNVSLYSYGSLSSITSNPSTSVSIPSSTEVLTLLVSTLQANSGNIISSISVSDNILSYGGFSGTSGHVVSYNAFLSAATSKSMSATINAAFNCKTVTASFIVSP